MKKLHIERKIILTKQTTPIVSEKTVVGTKVEYRVFGILLYKKELFYPIKYGIEHFDMYQIEI